jgi:hypothetical protein
VDRLGWIRRMRFPNGTKQCRFWAERIALARVQENIGAAAIELTPDDLREIGSAASKITVQGARYPEELERLTYRLATTRRILRNGGPLTLRTRS